MTPGMRAAMGEAAVRAAKAIDYQGAGTVEFLVDASDGLRTDRFYFMEMNTRLQVEHPVTEAITGHDLVELQLRAAAGENTKLSQDDLEFFGHAFEARIYAEDAAKGFLPATGTLEAMTMPTAIARVDTGVREGDTVTSHYDPMIAKIIVHDRTRDAALTKLRNALDNTRIVGTTTNTAFLRGLADNTDFAEGRVDTGLIERHLATLPADKGPDFEGWALAAMAGLGLPRSPTGSPSPWESRIGWRAWGEAVQTIAIAHEGEARDIGVRIDSPHHFAVTMDGETRALDCDGPAGQVEINGRRVRADTMTSGARITVTIGTRTDTFNKIDPLDVAQSATATSDAVTAPMPGTVLSIACTAGDAVNTGQTVMVLEAMKMEQALKSPRDGIVESVTVHEGDQVEDGAILLTLTTQE